jgi:hypothetical protein
MTKQAPPFTTVLISNIQNNMTHLRDANAIYLLLNKHLLGKKSTTLSPIITTLSKLEITTFEEKIGINNIVKVTNQFFNEKLSCNTFQDTCFSLIRGKVKRLRPIDPI